MSLSKVLTRGQLTLPKDVREAAGITAGDLVTLTVTGPGRVELQVVPRMKLADALERYVIDRPLDEAQERAAWQAVAASDAIGQQ
jgi:AbrB family looped-hinge helix DNA binding protein